MKKLFSTTILAAALLSTAANAEGRRVIGYEVQNEPASGNVKYDRGYYDGYVAAQKDTFIPTREQAYSDRYYAAESFIEHVNHAKLAVDMNDTATANMHIAHAKAYLNTIDKSVDTRYKADVLAGYYKLSYDGETNEYVYPFRNEKVSVSKSSKARDFSRENIVVKDARAALITINVDVANAYENLRDAEDEIADGSYSDASEDLEDILQSSVRIKDETAMNAEERARGNITVAKKLINYGNYRGAEHALEHAEDSIIDLKHSREHRADTKAKELEMEVNKLNKRISS